MKTEQRLITLYIAKDGTEFAHSQDCEERDAFLVMLEASQIAHDDFKSANVLRKLAYNWFELMNELIEIRNQSSKIKNERVDNEKD